MTRLTAAVALVVLVTTAVGTIPVTGAAQQGTETTNSTESAIAPGEHLGGVVGVQGAEFAGEVERRTFGIAIARASSDEGRADLLAEKRDDVAARLVELDERKQRFDRAETNGTMSDGSYDARVAVLAAQLVGLQRQLDAIETASGDLPSELLEREGVDPSTIQALREDASALTGPEVAARASEIAGPEVGTAIATNEVQITVGPAGNESATVGDPSVDSDPTVTDGGEEDDSPLTVELG